MNSKDIKIVRMLFMDVIKEFTSEIDKCSGNTETVERMDAYDDACAEVEAALEAFDVYVDKNYPQEERKDESN